jgi:putative chitinase
LADKDELTAITRRINGGLNGLEDRRRLCQRAKSLLGA